MDRAQLAYADPEAERAKDNWDLRLFGRPGRLRLDFSAVRQDWLREATKGWAAVSLGRVGDGVLAHRLGSLALLSAVLASGPGGGHDPASLGRADVECFLARVRSPNFPSRDKPFGTRARASTVEECAQVLREARELGLVPTLGATFAFSRGDRLPRISEEPPGRALPAGVIAQLDASLDLLASVPGASGRARLPTLGTLDEHAGEMAVLLKGTGRRVGEVASLRLECLGVDEHGKDVLLYDNHKAGGMGRRLPLADSALVAAVRAQQAWVRSRFPSTIQWTTGASPARSRTGHLRWRTCTSTSHGWPCRWASAPSPPMSAPAARLAPSGPSAPPARTSSLTPLTCRSCLPMQTTYAGSARRWSPQGPPTGQWGM